jgi:hypothetical protein
MQALQIRIVSSTAAQQSAVAELMAPTENPIGRPSIGRPSTTTPYALVELVASPAEPVDEPGDDD